MGFYVESADRPARGRHAAEDIQPGELIAENGSDKYRLADDQNDDIIRYLARKPRSGQFIAFDEDDTPGDTYSSSDDDLVPAQPLADGDVVKCRTPADPGGNESSPSINDGDVVGVIDSSAGTLSDSTVYPGRVVEEGYTDGESTPTTYNRSNNNFLALGTAERDSATSFDDVVRVQVQRGTWD